MLIEMCGEEQEVVRASDQDPPGRDPEHTGGIVLCCVVLRSCKNDVWTRSDAKMFDGLVENVFYVFQSKTLKRRTVESQI